jgi:hypothetical protein
MTVCAPGGPCYLAEWYPRDYVEASLEVAAAKLGKSVASMCAEGSPVQLVTMLAVPTDEVVFAVFAASSEAVVAQACRRAGLPADRLTPAACTGVE